MKVILIYDIELKEPKDQRRLNKIKKKSREYLHHIQKSVFEGEITPSQLYKFKVEILEIIDRKKDNVIIYKMPDSVQWEREVLTEKEVGDEKII